MEAEAKLIMVDSTKKLKAKVEEEIEEVKFELAALRKYCIELFNVNIIVFDGAFHKLEGSFSKTEATQIIKNFLNKIQG